MKTHDFKPEAAGAQPMPAAAPSRETAGTPIQRHPLQEAMDSSPRLLAQRQAIGAINRTGLPDSLRSGIESLSGMDMADVRVHRNSARPAQLNALAYAQGDDIHLGPGQEHHLPHEAWHVVQQRQGRVQPTLQRRDVAINDDTQLEAEADRMGSLAAAATMQRQTEADIMGKKAESLQVQLKEETPMADQDARVRNPDAELRPVAYCPSPGQGGSMGASMTAYPGMVAQRCLLQGAFAAQHQFLDAITGEVVQRVVRRPNGGLNPAATHAWAGLTTAQKSFARRLMNDPYTEYQFNTSQDFLTYVANPAGGTQPVATVTLGARQQAAVPNDPADPLFDAYTASGQGKDNQGTTTHKSNWAHYVMGQYTAAQHVVDTQVADFLDNYNATWNIEARRDAALLLADRLDSQLVDAVNPLATQATGANHPLGLVEPPVHHVDVQYVTKQTPGQWVQVLQSQPAYNFVAQQWQLQQQWAWQWQQPQQYTERQENKVYGQELHTELTEPVRLQQELVGMWNEVVVATGQGAQHFPEAAVPRWGPMKTDGIGTWVIAEYTPNSAWAVGSDSDTAAAASPWNIGNLGHRKTTDRAGRYYIQGHLLNDNMGGPGLAYNMTPLSGEISASSINANQGHLHVIEGQAKAALAETVADRNPGASPRPNPITGIRYAVLGSWRGHGPRATIANRAAQAVNILQGLKGYLAGTLNVATPGNLTIQQFHAGLMGNAWALPGGNGPRFWNDPSTGLKSYVDAVVPAANRNGVTVDAAIGLMTSNANLWDYENTNVPSHIDYRLTTARRNGDQDSHGGTLENKISSDPAQPYG